MRCNSHSENPPQLKRKHHLNQNPPYMGFHVTQEGHLGQLFNFWDDEYLVGKTKFKLLLSLKLTCPLKK